MRKVEPMKKKKQKPMAITFYDDEIGAWKIKTDVVWIDSFETEEEADTYAMRNGCDLVNG
jgi:hypothetical protein